MPALKGGGDLGSGRKEWRRAEAGAELLSSSDVLVQNEEAEVGSVERSWVGLAERKPWDRKSSGAGRGSAGGASVRKVALGSDDGFSVSASSRGAA